jgi:hypothetical protein
MTKDLLKKFDMGDALTDKDCRELHAFYHNMAHGAELLGPRFHFFWLSCYLNRTTIERYLQARDLDIPTYEGK